MDWMSSSDNPNVLRPLNTLPEGRVWVLEEGRRSSVRESIEFGERVRLTDGDADKLFWYPVCSKVLHFGGLGNGN